MPSTNSFPFSYKTRLNMLFIPTPPVKAEFTAMLRILSNSTNVEQCKEGRVVMSNAKQ